MGLPTFHGLLAQSILMYFGLLGAWGLVLGFRHAAVDSAYRGALFIGILIAVAQMLVGVVLLIMGLLPRDLLHFLYGLSLIVAIPLARQYLVGRYLTPPFVYGLTCLFMAGLAIRAITTGQ